MLIKVQAHTGVEFINPDQITHVSMMRGYALIHLSNQAMLPIDLVEWDEIAPMLVKPQSRIDASADHRKSFATMALPDGMTADQALKAVQSLTRGDVKILRSHDGRITFEITDVWRDDQDNQQAFIDANEPL